MDQEITGLSSNTGDTKPTTNSSTYRKIYLPYKVCAISAQGSLYSPIVTYRAPRVEAAYAYGRTFSAGLVTSAFRNVSEADKSQGSCSHITDFCTVISSRGMNFSQREQTRLCQQNVAMRPHLGLLAPQGETACVYQGEGEEQTQSAKMFQENQSLLFWGFQLAGWRKS